MERWLGSLKQRLEDIKMDLKEMSWKAVGMESSGIV